MSKYYVNCKGMIIIKFESFTYYKFKNVLWDNK